MKVNRDILFSYSGVTLVELLVVISIIAVVSTIALVSFGSSKNQLGRQNVARELKVAFERARFDSVKRRAQSSNQASVTVTANSFTLKTDTNQNGTLETAEALVNTSWNPSVSIRQQNGTALADTTVAFNQRGETVVTGGTAVAAAVFLVCNGDCAAPTSSNSNLVLVTATGTVNILPGGASAPTFVAPNVNSINSGANIRPDTRINANGG